MADDIVKLNVGGVHYKTCQATLVKDQKSKLAAMFSGRSKPKVDEDGSHFIDRDGELFRYILNYLRNGELLCSKETLSSLQDQLLAEARFYQLEGLIDRLSPLPKVFAESSIITSRDQENILLSWIPNLQDDAKWSILYKATRDGFNPSIFHKNCDGKSPTLVVIKSGDNIFGGYADKPWSSPAEIVHIPSPDSFLFSLKNPRDFPPEKLYPWSENSDHFVRGGVKSKVTAGPIFGEPGNVHDLATLIGTENRLGIAALQEGFKSKHNDALYFAGTRLFVIHELEVFWLAK